MKRVVLDTNIWLDWLVFNDSSVFHLKKTVSRSANSPFGATPSFCATIRQKTIIRH